MKKLLFSVLLLLFFNSNINAQDKFEYRIDTFISNESFGSKFFIPNHNCIIQVSLNWIYIGDKYMMWDYIRTIKRDSNIKIVSYIDNLDNIYQVYYQDNKIYKIVVDTTDDDIMFTSKLIKL